jgi:PTS system mannose-specific IIA component
MIGVIILAHGKLGEEFIRVGEKIVGDQENIHSFSVDAQEVFPEASDNLRRLIQTSDQGDGVLILTDLFGGTPSNLALSVLGLSKVEVLAGINLPMLVKVLSSRATESLENLVHLAQDAGKKYIHVANDVLHYT